MTSKLRNIYGSVPDQRDQGWDGVPITKNSYEGQYVHSNGYATKISTITFVIVLVWMLSGTQGKEAAKKKVVTSHSTKSGKGMTSAILKKGMTSLPGKLHHSTSAILKKKMASLPGKKGAKVTSLPVGANETSLPGMGAQNTSLIGVSAKTGSNNSLVTEMTGSQTGNKTGSQLTGNGTGNANQLSGTGNQLITTAGNGLPVDPMGPPPSVGAQANRPVGQEGGQPSPAGQPPVGPTAVAPNPTNHDNLISKSRRQSDFQKQTTI